MNPLLVPISSLPLYTGPINDGAMFAVASVGVTSRLPARSLVLPADPLLTVVDFSSSLPGSRWLEAGPGISISDGGAGSSVVISASSSGQVIVYDQTVVAIPASTQQNYNPTGWNAGAGKSRLQIQTPGGGATIGGLQATAVVDGQTLLFSNDSGTDLLVLSHEGAGSTAGNRFWLPGASDFTLIPLQSVMLWYDGPNARWRITA